jgi:hypothetical protein
MDFGNPTGGGSPAFGPPDDSTLPSLADAATILGRKAPFHPENIGGAIDLAFRRQAAAAKAKEEEDVSARTRLLAVIRSGVYPHVAQTGPGAFAD